MIRPYDVVAEHTCLATALQDPAPPLARNPLLFGRRSDRGRKLLLPLPWPRRVDDQPAVKTLLAGLNRRRAIAPPGCPDPRHSCCSSACPVAHLRRRRVAAPARVQVSSRP